jgi:hypothetical protein
MMIYPLHEKELYLEPYISMLKKLNYELRTKQIWIIIGYSFNDPVIREIFINNYKFNPGKKVVLLHPHAELIRREKLSVSSCYEWILLNQKFGEEDYTTVNYNLISKLKSNPIYSPEETTFQ